MVIFEFEVQCYKKVKVDGFSSDAREMARTWLIENLDDECDDILDDAYVSEGVEKK